MRYNLDTELVELKDNQKFSEGKAKIEVMSLNEFRHMERVHPHCKNLIHSMEHPYYCKAEFQGSCVIGTLAIPNKNHLAGHKSVFGYFIQADHLILLDDSGELGTLLSDMKEYHYSEDSSVASLFISILESFIQNDVMFLQKYENRLAEIEETLLNKLPDNFYETVITCRKELLILHTYYEQLIHMGEELELNSGRIFTPEDCAKFASFSNRPSHLHNHVEALREYVLQIREMYQYQIDINQNKVMTWLAVVTTIFLPLSLLAGWYGMNFQVMPELRWNYGYAGIILICIIIVTSEIIFFKKKKML